MALNLIEIILVFNFTFHISNVFFTLGKQNTA